MASLSERVSAQLIEMSKVRGFKTRLAEAMSMEPSGITPYVNGTREVSMAMLEAMSRLSGKPIAEIVCPPGDVIKQLDADEAALIRYARAWPKSVLHALLHFLHYWSDDPPVDEQTRKLREYWRVMSVQNRGWFVGAAAMLAEGMLPPDIQEGLTRHLEAERYKRRADDAKKRRKEP